MGEAACVGEIEGGRVRFFASAAILVCDTMGLKVSAV